MFFAKHFFQRVTKKLAKKIKKAAKSGQRFCVNMRVV